MNNRKDSPRRRVAKAKPKQLQIHTIDAALLDKRLIRFTTDLLRLTLCDQGIGIPAADLPHLFEPFHRAANVGNIAGTGLGLVITKEAVELHGGTISVVSQVNQGTTFVIQLPIL